MTGAGPIGVTMKGTPMADSRPGDSGDRGQPGVAAPGPLDLHSLDWRWRRFDALSAVELQNIYRARQQVFGIEQQCIYLDVDGCDEFAFHLAAWSPSQREPLAYARLLDPGVKYAEASMGRVLTTAPARGTGLGRELVRRTLACAESAWPGQANRISAQARLASFYAAFGYVQVGEPYSEDGIPHVEMLKG
jgi:ElaA protein